MLATVEKIEARPNLGIYGNSAARTDSKDKNSAKRIGRWKMHRMAQKLLPHEEVAGCYRNIRGRAIPGVDLVHNKTKGSMHYGNLYTCGSVWHCPICASKIAEFRRIELQAGMNAHVANGGSVVMMTLTYPHELDLPLHESLEKQSKALRIMKGQRRYKELMKAVGSKGSVRGLEATFGDNGWHPHTHDLIFCKDQENALQLLEEVRELWEKAVKRAGLGQINKHGFKLNGGDYAAEYVAKFGREPALENWGASHELTRGHIKTGKKDSRTPFDLLRDATDGDDMSGCLFQEYALQFKGKRQLYFSPGLKKYLEELKVKVDQDLAELGDVESLPAEDEKELIMTLDEKQWQLILRSNARGEVLEAAFKYGRVGVLKLLDLLASKPAIDEQWYELKRSFV